MKTKTLLLGLITIGLTFVLSFSVLAAGGSRAVLVTHGNQVNGTGGEDTQSSVNHLRPRYHPHRHRYPYYPYYPYSYGYILPPAPAPVQMGGPPNWRPVRTYSYYIGPIYIPRPCPYPYRPWR